MKRYITVLFLIVLIAPSVAFASWWNPLSWKIFDFLHKKETTSQVEVSKTPEEKINELQKQLDDLKNKQLISTPVPNKIFTAEKIVVPTVATNTEQYKKILIDKIAKVYTLTINISSYSDSIISTIDKRITFLNNLISKNETFINNTTDSFTIEVANLFIDAYKLDNEISETYKNTQNTLKNKNKEVIKALDVELVSVSQKTSISKSEFDSLSSSYDKYISQMSEIPTTQEKAVSDYKTYTDGKDTDYKHYFSLLEKKLNSLQNQIDNSSQINQNNYVPPIPTITIPRMQTCSFSSNSQWGQTTGSMSCY